MRKLLVCLGNQGTQIPSRYAEDPLGCGGVRVLMLEVFLCYYFEELALSILIPRLWVSAAHITSENARLRGARRVNTSCIDRDIDRLSGVALGVAGQGPLEQELARCEVGKKIDNLMTIILTHVTEVV